MYCSYELYSIFRAFLETFWVFWGQVLIWFLHFLGIEDRIIFGDMESDWNLIYIIFIVRRLL